MGQPGQVPAPLATHLIAQHTQDGVFTPSFYEVQPPALVGTQEEKAAALAHIDSVPAVCVARVSVPATKIKDFVRVMSENVNNFEAMVAAARGDS